MNANRIPAVPRSGFYLLWLFSGLAGVLLGWALLPLFIGDSIGSVPQLLLLGLLPGAASLPALWLLFSRGQALRGASPSG